MIWAACINRAIRVLKTYLKKDWIIDLKEEVKDSWMSFLEFLLFDSVLENIMNESHKNIFILFMKIMTSRNYIVAIFNAFYN